MLRANPAARFADDASRFEEVEPAELADLEKFAPTELAPLPLPRPTVRLLPSPVAAERAARSPPPLRTPSPTLVTGIAGPAHETFDAFPSASLAEHFSMLPIESTTMRVGLMTLSSSAGRKRKYRSPELCAKAAADGFPEDLEAYYRTPNKPTPPAKKRGALFPADPE
jgi:hypothetical protein